MTFELVLPLMGEQAVHPARLGGGGPFHYRGTDNGCLTDQSPESVARAKDARLALAPASTSGSQRRALLTAVDSATSDWADAGTGTKVNPRPDSRAPAGFRSTQLPLSALKLIHNRSLTPRFLSPNDGEQFIAVGVTRLLCGIWKRLCFVCDSSAVTASMSRTKIAMLGSEGEVIDHVVSTLSEAPGVLRCRHGERLVVLYASGVAAVEVAPRGAVL